MLETLVQEQDDAHRLTLMTKLGTELAQALRSRLRERDKLTLLCTSEDADTLARGLLESLQSENFQVSLICFWNELFQSETEAPRAVIVRRYTESRKVANILLVVNSRLSETTAVRTNLSELVYDTCVKRVILLAAFMAMDFPARLESEFPPEISERFEYVSLAEDDGQVPSERMTQQQEKHLIPDIIRERRQEARTTTRLCASSTGHTPRDRKHKNQMNQ